MGEQEHLLTILGSQTMTGEENVDVGLGRLGRTSQPVFDCKKDIFLLGFVVYKRRNVLVRYTEFQ